MRFDKKEILRVVLRYLPPVFSVLEGKDTEELCEIRIRANKPVSLVFADRTDYLTQAGRITGFISNDLLSFSQSEIEEIFVKLCGYSVHSLTQNIADGFITLENGIRIGVYGTAIVRDGKITSVRNVEGLNIRIPAEHRGCALPIYNRLFHGRAPNTIICGAPMSGKTTVLRDLCRLISDEEHKKIAVIDERCEMGGYDLGNNTDVLKNYPKASGISIALRTLSPEIIICDEIGSLDEARELCTLVNCGVKFIVTMHCSDLYELKKRPQFSVLNEAGAADACVFLSEKNFTVKKIMLNRS